MGKRLRESLTRRNIPVCIAAVLFCLTLFSVYLVTGLVARYTTSAQHSDRARVAKFSIEGGGHLLQDITADLAPGDSQKVDIQIKNGSEVAVEYTVEVTNVTKNLPLSFKMVKDDNGSAQVHTSADYIKFTEQQIPGSHTDKYLLTIEWPAAEGEDRAPERMGMVDYITVMVTAAQTD